MASSHVVTDSRLISYCRLPINSSRTADANPRGGPSRPLTRPYATEKSLGDSKAKMFVRLAVRFVVVLICRLDLRNDTRS